MFIDSIDVIMIYCSLDAVYNISKDHEVWALYSNHFCRNRLTMKSLN